MPLAPTENRTQDFVLWFRCGFSGVVPRCGRAHDVAQLLTQLRSCHLLPMRARKSQRSAISGEREHLARERKCSEHYYVERIRIYVYVYT